MNNTKYYAAAITAFVIWGFFGFVLKPIDHYPSLDIFFYRVFMAGGIMAFINIFIRPRILRETKTLLLQMPRQQRNKTIVQVLGGGVLLMANWFFFIYVMNHVSIKAASFAYIICPILTTLLASLLLKEKLSLAQWIAVGLSIISCAILSTHKFSDLLYSLIVALSYALYLVTQPKNDQLDKFLILAVQIGFSAILLLPFYPEYRGAVPTETSFYVFILIIAVVYTIIPLLLNLYALKGLKSSVMGILLYINPLINFIVAIGYYKEPINGSQVIAYLIILFSVVIFNLGILRKRKAIA
ncbi:MAG: EamA family transporter [Chitinophagaceae bacterium]|nr:EamA family transporter [Chitinophagaceae bacterium]